MTNAMKVIMKRFATAINAVAKRRSRTGHSTPQALKAWLLILTLVSSPAAGPFAVARGQVATKVVRASSTHFTQAPSPPIEALTVRHAPGLNSGRVEGSIRQLTGENVAFNGSMTVTGRLIVPGTPQFRTNGTVTFGGIVAGTGNVQPSNYTITLNSGTTLGNLYNRTDSIQLPIVPPPPIPLGTRSVTLNTTGQSPGDFATLRNLTLNGTAGIIAVPPGTYGNFIANSGNGFRFGIAGATQPAIYNLQQVTLNAGTQIQVVGPVIINLATGVSLSGQIGAPANPAWVQLNVASGGVALNGSSSIYGQIVAPSTTGTVTVNGGTRVKGTIYCDRFTINSGGIVQGFNPTQPPPPVLDSVAPASAGQGQMLTVTLRGLNTNWVDGATRASFGGEVSVGGAAYGNLGLVQVTNPTTATAQIAISPTAALAPRTVQVVTGNESVSLTEIFIVSAATPPGAASATVSIYAGAANPGFADGIATAARFRNLTGVAVGPNDVIYVADTGNHCIRRVATDGSVTTLAGGGTAGFADGSATTARFNSPQGVAVDAGGIVYVADTNNHRIRRIDSNGNVTTLAGNATPGLINGAGVSARFNAPRGLAADTLGNLYVADTGNHAVRLIDASGQVQTVAGDGTAGNSDSPTPRFNGLAGIAFDNGRLYVYIADAKNHRIRSLAPGGNTVMTLAGVDRGFADGTRATARFAEPSGIAPDGSGRLIVADTINSLIRSVHPEKAQNDEPGAISTIAGTGGRGLTEGAGNVAKFFTPRGAAVMLSSSIIIADTGNHTLRKIVLPPVIAAFSPVRGLTGAPLAITGERFDGRAPTRNTVRFAKVGGGQTTAIVTAATRTQLNVTVPADAATGPITVTTEGGTAATSTNFEVQSPLPVIAAFAPQSGFVGDTVTLTGTNLKLGGDTPSVTFTNQAGGRVAALVTFSSSTEVRATVPNGAVTGIIELTTQAGRAQTAGNFIVDTRQEFYIAASPSQITAVQGSSGVAVITLISPQNTFTQMAQLTATGLPTGVTTSFDPEQITSGASSTMRLMVSGTRSPGNYSFTVQATALADGVTLTRTATASITVQAAGQTTLAGRVLSTTKEPVIGATVSLDGRSATTDAAGAFLLSGVTAGIDRPVMVDGRTASAPNRTYPVITEPATIIAGQANAIPYTFYLPPIDTQYETTVVPGQTTIVTTPRVSVEMMIPTGANLRNRDGSPVARASITPVAIDRTPAPLPSNIALPIVFTSQPGGAVSDIAMPVTYPNLWGLNPGTRVPLYNFNHDTVQWYVYGFGNVSNDGRMILPEPGVGLRDFSWHGPAAPPTGACVGQGCNQPGTDPNDCGRNVSNRGPHTVVHSTGAKEEITTDIVFGGARGGLELTRIYNSDFGRSNIQGRFGRGAKDNYAISLTGAFQVNGSGRLLMPAEGTGRLFSYLRTDPDGALVFNSTETISQLGDVVRKLTNGSFEYRMVSGDLYRFDSSGRLTAMADRNGNTTNFSYIGNNLTQVTDPVGRSINLSYNGNGLVIEATDPIGRGWVYAYDGQSRLTKVTDPLGYTTEYAYDILAQLTSVKDKRGIVKKQIVYDGNGRVTAQQFADGGVETYEYLFSGTVVTGITITDPLGRKLSKRFSSQGYVIGLIDELGQSSEIERTIDTSLPIKITGPCGCPETTRQFDARGNILASTDRLGQTTSFAYEPVFNNPTRMMDRLGRITNYSYDAMGNLISASNALSQTTTFAYDQYGELTEITDPLGHKTTMEYDAQGNLIAAADALNNRSTMQYDVVGRIISLVDPLGRRSEMTYDGLNRMLSAKDPSNAVTRFEYDGNGNLIATTNALNNRWTNNYDGKNRLVAALDPINRITQFQYDAADQLIRVISPSTRKVSYTYDGRGQRATITDGIGGIIRFAYDYHRNLTALTDQRNNTTTFAYDELYRLAQRTDPVGRKESFQYDGEGNLIASIDRIGRQTTYTYDALNRLTRALYADAIVDYAYDPAGRLTNIADTQGGLIVRAYDNANRMLSEQTSEGLVSYTYNAADQRASMTAANAPVVTYGYDTAGRLRTITQGSETFTYAYDTLSRMQSLQRPNSVTTSYQYDNVNRLARLTHAGALTTIEDFQYGYNVDDEIAAITSLASGTLLATAKTATAANAANRIPQFGQASYSFDNEGQTTTKTDTQGIATYNWDARGRLTSASLPGGQTVSYSYDALGRRKSRTASGMTTSFLYDGADVVRDAIGNVGAVDYVNGSGVDQKLRQVSAGNNLYFMQDHLSSTVALTNSAGSVIELTQYEAFGDSTGNALTRYSFTGRERDEIVALLYYRARWYDAQQGRFFSEDPIGLAGGSPNLYSYSLGDPILLNDPDGQSPFIAEVLQEIGGFMQDFPEFDPRKPEPPKPRKKDSQEPPKELNASCSLRKLRNNRQDAVDVMLYLLPPVQKPPIDADLAHYRKLGDVYGENTFAAEREELPYSVLKKLKKSTTKFKVVSPAEVIVTRG